MEINDTRDFHYESYLLYNPDLRHLNVDEALQHWKNHGAHEKRIMVPSSEFDHLFYVNYYPDLKNLDFDRAFKHWRNHGKAEGRLGLDKF